MSIPGAVTKPVWGFKRKAWPTITISGADRVDFLQRLSTQNFSLLKEGDVAPGAFLTGGGGVVGLFLAYVRKEQIDLLCEPQAGPVLVQHVHKLHFAERLEIAVENSNWVEVRGPKAKDFLQQNLKAAVEVKQEWPKPAVVAESLVLPAEPWGSPGWIVQTSQGFAGLEMLTDDEYYAQRAMNLFPRDQVDTGEGNILLEAGLTDYIHRNKGCYPGQEVIERIFTYGNVAKKLVLLEGHARELESGNELYMNERKVGNVTSRHLSAPNGAHYYVGTVLRLSAVEGHIFSLGAGQTPQLKVLKVAGGHVQMS